MAGPRRLVAKTVALDTEASTVGMSMFADSTDIIKLTITADSAGTVLDFTALGEGDNYYVPAVVLVHGADSTNEDNLRRGTGLDVGEESRTGVTFGGTALPSTASAPGGIPVGGTSATGVVWIALQAGDLLDTDTSGVWLLVYLVENITSPARRILAAKIQITVVPN
jgi:hypothetical protein